jgi:hypothetical protein
MAEPLDFAIDAEVFAANIDEEAWSHSADETMGEYFLPEFEQSGFKDYLKDMPHFRMLGQKGCTSPTSNSLFCCRSAQSGHPASCARLQPSERSETSATSGAKYVDKPQLLETTRRTMVMLAAEESVVTCCYRH